MSISREEAERLTIDYARCLELSITIMRKLGCTVAKADTTAPRCGCPRTKDERGWLGGWPHATRHGNDQSDGDELADPANDIADCHEYVIAAMTERGYELVLRSQGEGKWAASFHATWGIVWPANTFYTTPQEAIVQAALRTLEVDK